jgi:hypothetical protein
MVFVTEIGCLSGAWARAGTVAAAKIIPASAAPLIGFGIRASLRNWSGSVEAPARTVKAGACLRCGAANCAAQEMGRGDFGAVLA